MTLLLALVALLAQPTMPSCAEDAVIVGTGEYAAGRWSGYECGPSWDDYIIRDYPQPERVRPAHDAPDAVAGQIAKD